MDGLMSAAGMSGHALAIGARDGPILADLAAADLRATTCRRSGFKTALRCTKMVPDLMYKQT